MIFASPSRAFRPNGTFDMKVLFALSAFLLSAGAAEASVLWDNGGAPIASSGINCDNNSSSCGSNGWTIYDDFSLASGATVTGFTYDTSFLSGSSSSYSGTNWSIWTSDPRSSFGSGPSFSGTLLGTVSGTANLSRVVGTGLSVALAAGTYWLGLQNNTVDSSITDYLPSNNSRLGRASQSDNSGTFYNSEIPDASFTVTGGSVPEPASWALMVAGFGLVGSAVRRRQISVTA